MLSLLVARGSSAFLICDAGATGSGKLSTMNMTLFGHMTFCTGVKGNESASLLILSYLLICNLS